MQKDKIRGAVKENVDGGIIWIEMTLPESRVERLSYKDLLAVTQDEAKMCAEQALHDALHHRSGFECAGYKVLCWCQLCSACQFESPICTRIAERGGLCPECEKTRHTAP